MMIDNVITYDPSDAGHALVALLSALSTEQTPHASTSGILCRNEVDASAPAESLSVTPEEDEAFSRMAGAWC